MGEYFQKETYGGLSHFCAVGMSLYHQNFTLALERKCTPQINVVCILSYGAKRKFVHED